VPLVIENLSVQGLIVLLGVTGLLLHTDGFLKAFADDDNIFWEMDSGHALNIIEERVLLSLTSGELHTWQSQAITGTPCEVPEPKIVTKPSILTKLSIVFQRRI
jgi:hypothetical protein